MDALLTDTLAKIEKIRALAERGGTQAEAEVAAAKMNQLLLKHNLTLMDVEEFATRTNQAVKDEWFEMPGSLLWKSDLLFTVAWSNLCKAVRWGGSRGRKPRMHVIGHAHNLVVVREMYEWLFAEASRLSRQELKAAKRDASYFGLPVADSAWKTAFCVGFVRGINEAFTRVRRELKAETAAEQWAIVPEIEQEVEDRLAILYPKLGTGRRTRINGNAGDAYAKGRAAGAAINIGSRQVGGSAASKAIGR